MHDDKKKDDMSYLGILTASSTPSPTASPTGGPTAPPTVSPAGGPIGSQTAPRYYSC